MNQEFNFFLKIVRNAFILSGLMFVSTYSTKTLNYEMIKPIIVFLLTYIFTELARHYQLLPKNKNAQSTLIFNGL